MNLFDECRIEVVTVADVRWVHADAVCADLEIAGAFAPPHTVGPGPKPRIEPAWLFEGPGPIIATLRGESEIISPEAHVVAATCGVIVQNAEELRDALEEGKPDVVCVAGSIALSKPIEIHRPMLLRSLDAEVPADLVVNFRDDSAVRLTGSDQEVRNLRLVLPKGARNTYAVAIQPTSDATRIVVRDLEVTGGRAAWGDTAAGGILIETTHFEARGVLIQDVFVHRIGASPRVFWRKRSRSVAVRALGKARLRDLAVIGLRAEHLSPADSEVISLTGRLEHYVVARAKVIDSDNIGIDLIFGENDEDEDQYFHGGLVQDSIVAGAWDVNRAHGAAIYVDGASGVDVRNNLVAAAPRGIEIAGENKKRVSEVIVADNVVAACQRRDGTYGVALRVCYTSFSAPDPLSTRFIDNFLLGVSEADECPEPIFAAFEHPGHPNVTLADWSAWQAAARQAERGFDDGSVDEASKEWSRRSACPP